MRRLLLVVLLVGVGLLSSRFSEVMAATLTVSTTDDCNVANCGSLRDAINQANASPGADTISITAQGTLTLTSNLPTITDTLTIVGPGQANFSIAATCAACRALASTVALTASGFTVSTAQNGGIVIINGTADVHDVTVRNIGTGGGLVAAFQAGGQSASLANVNITGNNASDSTIGLLVFTGTVTVSGSNLTGNTVAVGQSGGTLTIRNSLIADNVSHSDSPGGFAHVGGTLIVDNSLVARNSGTEGGAYHQFTGGSATFNNTTFFGNSAPVGGALLMESPGSLSLNNVTITGNSSAPGGLQVLSGTAVVRNTIIAGNTGANCSGPITSQGNNLSSDGTCNLTAVGDKPSTQPGFATGTLASNGGPTQTVALAANSPAVDAGSSAAPSCSTGSTDQRGFPRVTDGNGDGTAVCDIGAYELAAFVQATTTPAATATAVAPTPFVLQPIPQVFQNPGAIAAVAGNRPSMPTPREAVAPTAAQPLVIMPPHTGDAGLLADEE